TVYGTTLEDRFDYFVGVYNGSPTNQERSTDQNYIVEARATMSPMGPVNANELPFTAEGEDLPTRASFTLQGYHGKIQTTEESYNLSNSVLTPVQTSETEETTTAGADVWFQQGRLIAFGEYYWRRLEPESTGPAFNSSGAWGQVIVNAYKDILGVGARANWIDPNSDLSNDEASILEGQIAWFIKAPEQVLKLRYAWENQQSPDEDALGDFILPYPVGTSHVVTLQFTLAF
ncbi:MAG TPA: hypothetical protein VM432_08620, partial [Bdellovibrionales bacterium]|nr:hypothetical protein [Bdellovibrionales bacterium]